MKIRQSIVRNLAGLEEIQDCFGDIKPNLILLFGAIDHFQPDGVVSRLPSLFPDANIVGCSTAGEITAEGVDDGTCVISAIEFANTVFTCASTPLNSMDDSFAAGVRLGQAIAALDLKAVLLFGPGVQINGSALVDGMTSIIGSAVTITGGLAGDGGAFQQTFTVGTDGISDHHIVAIGLSGDHLRLGHGSFGGWEAFGPARKVTRCAGNILYELDGEPALGVYKRYLGDHASGLPASGLLFPFAMLGEDHNAIGLIRTILAVDESQGSLTLAGEINANGYLKLMHASTDKLVNGAESAAELASKSVAGMSGSRGEQLAILVSCVGRKLVMGNRVDEEVEAVGEVLGQDAILTGFYSYGEISPFTPGAACKLHNQTMTITCLSED
ncbi:FIST signal transduction protein [Azonexus sp.]|uniref:FIST signal transduction protein n=1 Tax=Azonexus sp. TaxID=1872668 RepID=UPI0027B9A897|nr:FIST N-terminal domain-containing protein [Azonexus sp.]